MKNILDTTPFLQDPISTAKFLLGKEIKILENILLITEVEAYLGAEDKASHARFGKTKRSKILFEERGVIYIFDIWHAFMFKHSRR